MTGPPGPRQTRGQPARPRRRPHVRLVKVWVSVVGTVVGALAITWGVHHLQSLRETDLADASGSVTQAFLAGATSGAPPVRFVDVASELGIGMRHGAGARRRRLPEDTGSGLAFGDVDGDGAFDLYVVNVPGSDGEGGSNRLYLSRAGRFLDVTEEAGVGDPGGFGMGAYFADFDGDADVDLLVTNRGPNRLYENLGDGTFRDVAEAAGVADPSWSTGAAIGDYDRDGHLDFYVCNYVDYDDDGLGPDVISRQPGGGPGVPFTLNPSSFDPQPNRLYRNRGDGTFEEVAEACGVQDSQGRSLGATFCDLDGDGWLDLYVSNDVSPNRLFRNRGGDERPARPVRFIDLSTITGTADPRGSMGLSVGEIGWMEGKCDGLPDLFITHWVAQENALYQSVQRPRGAFEYRDRTRQYALGEISLDRVGWGCALVDIDLDGRVDVAVANGSTLEEKGNPLLLRAESMFLFWNDGRRFHDLAQAAGPDCARPRNGRGLAACDFDADGDVDFAISENRGPVSLLRNLTPRENLSLTVRLDGPATACFGARIELLVGDTAQYRWHGADVSYLSGHAPEHVFGLGKEPRARRLRVRWADGAASELDDVPAGRVRVPHPGTAPRGVR